MKVLRKKREGIKIEHNKKLFWVIIVLLVILILLIYFIIKGNKTGTNDSQNNNPECSIDSDCVPAVCCHAESCIPSEKAPDCSDIFCSMVCSGPLDCGAGSCGCVNNKCVIIPNK